MSVVVTPVMMKNVVILITHQKEYVCDQYLLYSIVFNMCCLLSIAFAIYGGRHDNTHKGIFVITYMYTTEVIQRQ